MDEDPKIETTQHIIEYEGKQLHIYWDGFCLTINSADRYAFVASVNDPEVSQQGNVSIIFGTSEELAQRLEIKQ